MKLTKADDAALVRAALEGNQSAFLVMYDRYRRGVEQHVGQFIPQREEMEDVVLESFQKAFSQIATYNSDYRFSTWLYRIARNTAFDHLQKGGISQAQVQVNSIDDVNAGINDIVSYAGDPEAEVIRSQEYDKLVAAIDGLPDTYRTVGRMVLLENYGYQEVAEATGLPLNTVKTRVRRAKEQIIRIMDTSEEDQI